VFVKLFLTERSPEAGGPVPHDKVSASVEA
jgi:hypothetical protein